MNYNQNNLRKESNDSFTLETGIGPTTDKIINTILDRLTTDKFREKLIDKIVAPVTNVINEKIRPYVYIGIGLYALLIILLVTIIILLISKNKQK